MNEEQKYTLYWTVFVMGAIFFLYIENWLVLFGLFSMDWTVRNQWKYLPKDIKLPEKVEG